MATTKVRRLDETAARWGAGLGRGPGGARVLMGLVGVVAGLVLAAIRVAVGWLGWQVGRWGVATVVADLHYEAWSHGLVQEGPVAEVAPEPAVLVQDVAAPAVQ